MKKRALLWGLLIWSWSLSGCLWHLDRNAPGDVDLTKPPRQIDVEAVELPEDPGERVLVLKPGPWVTAGGAVGVEGASRSRGRLHVGFELSATFYERAHSHDLDDAYGFLGPVGMISHKGLGMWTLNLGWSALELDLSVDRAALGPFHIEVQRSLEDMESFAAVAAGLALDPFDRDVGLRVSGHFVNLYVEMTAMVSGELSLMGGMVLKVPLVWIWSR